MKYELTEKTDYRQGSNGDMVKVYKIRAKKSFKTACAYYSIEVKEGDLGGYVASEKNLSQEGTCWVSEAAAVYENAKVTDDALVTGYANVSGYAVVEKQARVGNNSRVNGNAVVTDNARVDAVSLVCHNALVAGDANVYGKSTILENAVVRGRGEVLGSTIKGDAILDDNYRVEDCIVGGVCEIKGSSGTQPVRPPFGALLLNGTLTETTDVFVFGPHRVGLNSSPSSLVTYNLVTNSVSISDEGSAYLLPDLVEAVAQMSALRSEADLPQEKALLLSDLEYCRRRRERWLENQTS